MKLKNLTLLFLLSIATPALAGLFSNLTTSQHRLSHVNDSIKALETNIEASTQQRDTLADSLQENETAIAKVQAQLKKTQEALHQKSQTLVDILSQRDKLIVKLAAQNTLMKKHLLATYMLSREPALKLYLNQQDPETIDRYVTYARYLIAARQQLIQSMETNLTALQAVSEKIQQAQQALLQTKLHLDQQNQTLRHAQQARRQTLRHIQQHLKTQQNTLAQLQSDKSHLQKLITLLNQKNYYLTPGKDFSANRGLLPWPVKNATLLQAYNAPLADGRLRATGILLKSQAGDPIHAIYPGKVVFAHWLRGYGFLTIIQHGQHYMTLYARCQTLDVQLGDHVEPGQTIATVGNSGGYQEDALYFEIRYDSKPENPTLWLRKKI